MSVILIRPNTPDTSHSGIVSIQYPINVGYLAAYLKENSVDCFVKDFEVEEFEESKLVNFIKKINPILIGFSCMTPHIINAAKMAGIVKNNFPNIKTIAGGVHPSAIPEQTLKEFPQFDIIAVGEGEETLLELYQRLDSGKGIDDMAGIAFKDQQGIKINPRRPLIEDIDKIPFPDRSQIDINRYKKSHVSRGFSRSFLNIAEVTISRGCPYNCIFCASKIIHSNKVRFRSLGNITAEIDELINKHEIQHISFLDDTFTIKQEILEPVCSYLKKNKISFDCFTRVNDINENKIKLMVESGCKKISFGVESGSQKVLNLLKKGITIDQVRQAFRLCRKYGLSKIEGTFMIGCHPDESLEDIELTRRFIFELRPDILGLFISIPYPGTELNRILKERKLLKEEKWDEFKLFFGNPSWKSSKVPNDVLEKKLKDITYAYYLNPLFMIKSVLKIRSIRELKYWLALTTSLIKVKLFKLKGLE